MIACCVASHVEEQGATFQASDPSSTLMYRELSLPVLYVISLFLINIIRDVSSQIISSHYVAFSQIYILLKFFDMIACRVASHVEEQGATFRASDPAP